MYTLVSLHKLSYTTNIHKQANTNTDHFTTLHTHFTGINLCDAIIVGHWFSWLHQSQSLFFFVLYYNAFYQTDINSDVKRYQVVSAHGLVVRVLHPWSWDHGFNFYNGWCIVFSSKTLHIILHCDHKHLKCYTPCTCTGNINLMEWASWCKSTDIVSL